MRGCRARSVAALPLSLQVLLQVSLLALCAAAVLAGVPGAGAEAEAEVAGDAPLAGAPVRHLAVQYAPGAPLRLNVSWTPPAETELPEGFKMPRGYSIDAKLLNESAACTALSATFENIQLYDENVSSVLVPAAPQNVSSVLVPAAPHLGETLLVRSGCTYNVSVESDPYFGGPVPHVVYHVPPASPAGASPKCPDGYCLHGGTCLYYHTIQEQACQCAEGYEGQRCERPQKDAVLSRRKRDSSSAAISLTFVVDTTTSMGGEIEAVKHAMNDILDHLKLRFSGNIVNYILVDFNDPDVTLVSKTTNAEEFRKKINSLALRSPLPPCPEMSMTGLSIALKESSPKSNIFLFTDATAKDFEKGPEVVNLVQRTQSKVLFVLTGNCGGDKGPSYQIYETIARISNGHLFFLEKNEVGQVLNFVKENFGRKNLIHVGHVPSTGILNNTIPVDPSMSKLTVTVTGKHPTISFKDPTGKLVPGYSTLHLGSILSKTVYSPAPGIWSLAVSASSEGRFVVQAESTFSIIYGFSVKLAEQITETAPRPLTGKNNFLLIQVINNTDPIYLSEVKVKDSSYNVLFTISLHPVTSEPGTYKTDTFVPPSSIFFLEVHGKDSKNNSLTRTSESGILVQEAEPPLITSTELTATLKSPFKLMCHVESLIPFNATWYKGNNIISSEERFPQTARFYYLIANTTWDSAGKYTCEARNTKGTVRQNVILHVKDAPPTVSTPKAIKLIARRSGVIPCQVESDLHYVVMWTRKEMSGTVQFVSGDNYAIADTGNLTVSSVQKSHEGTYQCTATSKAGNGTSEMYVHVIENVEVFVAFNKLEFKGHEHVHLSCTASGSPPVTLLWKKGTTIIEDSDSRIRHEDNKIFLDIENATKHDEGVYECEGKNEVNTDRKHIELVYLEPPTLNFTTSPSQTLIGNKYIFQCSASGSPKPTITWRRNDTNITSGLSEQILDNGTLIIHKLSLNHSGVYQCLAENKVGKDTANKSIEVGSLPEFDSNLKDNISIDVLTNGTISCNVSGHPNPKIIWSRKDGKLLSVRFSAGSSCSMHLAGGQQ